MHAILLKVLRKERKLASELHNVSPNDIEQFPNDHPSMVCGKLFCSACRAPLLKK